MLIRDGAAGVVDQCEIADAGAFGVELVDPREGSEVTGCVIRGSKNKAGIGFGGVGAEDNVLVKGNKVTRGDERRKEDGAAERKRTTDARAS